jgi:glucose/mannose-6-phosphate isomerase
MADIKGLIDAFGQQLIDAKAIGQAAAAKLPAPAPVTNVNLFGLGGSAFGGEIIRNLIFTTSKVPFTIFRGYEVPAYLNANSLVIASSYSGNTEETLEAAELARKAGARIIVVTSGGKLKEWAGTHGFSVITLPGGYPPRAAAGLSFVQQLYILRHYGLIPDFEADLDESIAVVQQFREQAETKKLGDSLKDRAVILYSSDAIDSIAIRWRQQINENSKQLCWHHVVPEMNHNELVGWEHPKFMLERASVIMLRSSFEHPRVAIRFEVNRQIIGQHTQHIVDVHAKGHSKLAQLMYLLHYGDYVSIHLAEANGVDAAPVKVIDFLKNELSKR